MMLRFHLDEHVAPAVGDALRRRGIAVTTSSDSGLLGASDEEHLAFALAGGRVMVTHDADFLRLHRGPACWHRLCSAGGRPTGELVCALLLLASCLSAGDMADHVEFL
jgi:hypothetical protein